ncbi:unnamed protein product, partial [Laminaria digitata]
RKTRKGGTGAVYRPQDPRRDGFGSGGPGRGLRERRFGRLQRVIVASAAGRKRKTEGADGDDDSGSGSNS